MKIKIATKSNIIEIWLIGTFLIATNFLHFFDTKRNIVYNKNMSKLYFKYGTMGSSKTAQALMCRFNYIQ